MDSTVFSIHHFGACSNAARIPQWSQSYGTLSLFYLKCFVLPLVVVVVQLVTDDYRVGEEATSLSVCMLKEGEAATNTNVMLTTLPSADSMTEGKWLLLKYGYQRH